MNNQYWAHVFDEQKQLTPKSPFLFAIEKLRQVLQNYEKFLLERTSKL